MPVVVPYAYWTGKTNKLRREDFSAFIWFDMPSNEENDPSRYVMVCAHAVTEGPSFSRYKSDSAEGRLLARLFPEQG